MNPYVKMFSGNPEKNKTKQNRTLISLSMSKVRQDQLSRVISHASNSEIKKKFKKILATGKFKEFFKKFQFKKILK